MQHNDTGAQKNCNLQQSKYASEAQNSASLQMKLLLKIHDEIRFFPYHISDTAALIVFNWCFALPKSKLNTFGRMEFFL